MKKFIRQALALWSMLVLALWSSSVLPQSFTDAQYQAMSDIDIYGQNNSTTNLPNVLIILDNTGNWSTPFTAEIQALQDVLSALDANKFRVGLMMFTESGGSNSGPDGGYIRAAIRSLNATRPDGMTYKSALTSLITSLDKNDDRSNSGKLALAMAEAYKYFAGSKPYSGKDKVKSDYPLVASDPRSSQNQVVASFAGNALPSKGGTLYSSPVVNACASNYIIIISNGATQDPSSDNDASGRALNGAYADLGATRPADITGLSPSDSQTNYADEWARFMYKTAPQKITSFAIEVDPNPTGQGPGWSALLASIADNSNGKRYTASSSTAGDIKAKLVNAFNEIKAIDSVFASASLPVALNASGTYLNQIYMGMFRPDANGLPRWRGNLKQYQFGYNALTDTISLVDSVGNGAISSGADGFISANAVSFWSQPSTFWTNQPLGTVNPTSDSPDGPLVEKGGIAQGLRTAYATDQSGRKVYTCIDCGSGTDLSSVSDSSTKFSTANSALTTGLLGVSTSSDRSNLINWVRGTDNAGDEDGPGGSTTVRPSIHGDVLHSRPAVLNYGGSTGVVVFYGANDGMLHAVDGNQPAPAYPNAGKELWSFVVQEHLGRLSRLRNNTPEVLVGTSNSGTATARDYFVDGPIGYYQKIDASGTTTKAVVIFGMRRGGGQVYALDVTTPTAPKFLWKMVSGAAGVPAIGQTWSEPRVVKLKGYSNPVVVMGGGYDSAAEDQRVPGSTTRGNFILILDALTGSILNNTSPLSLSNFTTTRSVPADITVIDSDHDGYVDRAYAVDVGGNLYRLDFESNTGDGSRTASNWKMYQIASLGNGGSSPPRKFFYAPDAVLTNNFVAVTLGSGDREKPLLTTSADGFYTVYDYRTAKGTPSPLPSVVTRSDLYAIGGSTTTAAGCFLDLPGQSSGEKVINATKTVAGVTYFDTNTPNYNNSSTSMCKNNLGDAKLYQVPLFCGAPTSSPVGQGFPPSVVTGVVTITSWTDSTGNVVTGNKQVPFLIGGPNNKSSALEVARIKPASTFTRQRRYWFMERAR